MVFNVQSDLLFIHQIAAIALIRDTSDRQKHAHKWLISRINVFIRVKLIKCISFILNAYKYILIWMIWTKGWHSENNMC